MVYGVKQIKFYSVSKKHNFLKISTPKLLLFRSISCRFVIKLDTIEEHSLSVFFVVDISIGDKAPFGQIGLPKRPL